MIRNALYRLSFLGILYLAFWLSLDPALRWAAVRGGQKVFKAPVDIGRLRAGFFPPRLELERIVIADKDDPAANLLEIETAALRLEGRPLLKKKFIVSSASVIGIRVKTPRKKGRAAPPKPASAADAGGAQAGSSLVQEAGRRSSAVAFDRLASAGRDMAADYEIRPEELASVKLAQESAATRRRRLEEIKARCLQDGLTGRLGETRRQFQAAQAEGDKLKKVKLFKDAVGGAKKLAGELKSCEKDLEAERAAFQDDLKAVEDAGRKDAQKALEKLRLPSLDAKSLSEFLLGPKLGAQAAWALDAASRLGSSRAKRKGAAARSRGMTVEFSATEAYPAWAVREMKLSGFLPAGEEPLAFEGRATGFSSDPALFGEPAKITLSGRRGEGDKAASAHLAAVFDHRAAPGTDVFDFRCRGFDVPEFSLGDPESVRLLVSKGKAEMSAVFSVRNGALDGQVLFAETGIAFKPELGPRGGGEMVKKVLERSLKGVNRLNAKMDLSGSLSRPEWSIQSDLGQALSEGFERAAGGELAARRKSIEMKIKDLAGQRALSAQKGSDGERAGLSAELGRRKDQIRDLSAEIQKQIEKAEASLLGPFKKPDLKKLFR